MDTTVFFKELETYFERYGIKGEIVNDSFSTRCYAVFGKDTIGYPSVFLDKEDSVNCVDVLALEVHDAHNAEVKLEQQEFMRHIFEFLKITYDGRNEGVLVYKTLNRDNIKFSSNIPHHYSTVFTPGFVPVKKDDVIHSFLNTKMIEWCIRSDDDDSLVVFNRVDKVKEALLAFQTNKPSRHVLLHNIHLVNSDTLYNKFVFEVDGISYTFDFGKRQDDVFQLKIMGNLDYAPLPFSEKNLRMDELVAELELINSYIRLLEEK